MARPELPAKGYQRSVRVILDNDFELDEAPAQGDWRWTNISQYAQGLDTSTWESEQNTRRVPGGTSEVRMQKEGPVIFRQSGSVDYNEDTHVLFLTMDDQRIWWEISEEGGALEVDDIAQGGTATGFRANAIRKTANTYTTTSLNIPAEGSQRMTLAVRIDDPPVTGVFT